LSLSIQISTLSTNNYRHSEDTRFHFGWTFYYVFKNQLPIDIAALPPWERVLRIHWIGSRDSNLGRLPVLHWQKFDPTRWRYTTAAHVLLNSDSGEHFRTAVANLQSSGQVTALEISDEVLFACGHEHTSHVCRNQYPQDFTCTPCDRLYQS